MLLIYLILNDSKKTAVYLYKILIYFSTEAAILNSRKNKLISSFMDRLMYIIN